MNSFDFNPRTRIVFGPDKIDMLGQLAREIGASRALVVSDPGIIAVGHAERGVRSLAQAGIEVQVFDGVSENPTTQNVEAGTRFARDYKPDLLVGLGGGSSMDCAKGINFIHTNGGRMQDYWGTGKATQPMLPMIAVPTTAGTGSETQSFALIADAETHVKMACGDKKAACRVAILDPKLTLTQPPEVAALTGIDAISHALETYVTTRRNALSQIFSREAWKLLARSFPRIFEEPQDLEARGDMLLGASLAGLAIENSMLGATHACANPITSRNGTAHGSAIGIMLPHVIRKNGPEAGSLYAELLAEAPASKLGDESPEEGLARLVESFLEIGGLRTKLRDCGLKEGDFAQMAREAAEQWTGKYNPRTLDESELEELYRCAY